MCLSTRSPLERGPTCRLLRRGLSQPRTVSLCDLSESNLSITFSHADLSLEDITKLSTRFWNLHLNPIISADGAATTLITIQYNLVLGTILDHIGDRTDLDQLLQDMLQYRIWYVRFESYFEVISSIRSSGQFCLTEVDHGLDAINVETTATSLGHDGGFILHTPHSGAAK